METQKKVLIRTLMCDKIYLGVTPGEFETFLTVKTKLKEKNKMLNRKTLSVTVAAVTAALYVALTYLASLVGLSSGVIQFRLSEMLCILPAFLPAAIPGLFIGCILANLLTGAVVWDIVFGSLATLIGAIGAYLLRHRKYLITLPTIISNTVIVPFVLIYAYGMETIASYPFFALTVAVGEIVCAGVLGTLLYFALQKRGIFAAEHTHASSDVNNK